MLRTDAILMHNSNSVHKPSFACELPAFHFQYVQVAVAVAIALTNLFLATDYYSSSLRHAVTGRRVVESARVAVFEFMSVDLQVRVESLARIFCRPSFMSRRRAFVVLLPLAFLLLAPTIN